MTVAAVYLVFFPLVAFRVGDSIILRMYVIIMLVADGSPFMNNCFLLLYSRMCVGHVVV